MTADDNQASGDQITTGDIIGSTGVALGAGAQVTVYQMPTPAPALHQLRAPVGDFVGREQEIEQLVQALSNAGGAAAAISGVRGMGGIGKTELAYSVAQRLAEQFPDTQLLIELRGASSTPLSAEQALQTVIRAFEREAKLPDDLGELKGIYSSVLNGKRALILADDARDAAQVRPLLPPAGCALLVTSRNRFTLPGMAAIDLEMLPPADAEALLLEICPRVGGHAVELAMLCGYLPLALRVSASLLKSRPSRRVAVYLKKLGDERTRLEHLRDPHDSMMDIESSLHLSYEALAAAAQSALCQLSVFSSGFDRDAAQHVVKVPNGNEIDDVLEELCLLSLLEWDDMAERYSLHELVRVFAATRLADADAVQLRHARHYIKVASHAENNLYLNGQALAGLALFDRERAHIDAGWTWALAHAGVPNADRLLLNYPSAAAHMARLRYNKREQHIPQFEAWLHAARRLGRREYEAAALGNLGLAYHDLGEQRRAIELYEQSLAIVRDLGDRHSEGQALGNLGIAYADLGRVCKVMARRVS